MRRKILFLALIGLVMGVGPPALATTGTLVITTDTTLTEDHDATSVFVGIEIAADNVTLDCGGHAVFGGDAGIGIEIVNHTGVTVENCVVTAFSAGVVIGGSSNILRSSETYANLSGVVVMGNDNRVIGNRSHDNGDAGFRVAAPPGAVLTGTVFRDNRAGGNAGTGFVLWDAPGSRVVANVARANGNGFVFHHSGGSDVIGNVARGHPDQGFVFEHLRGVRVVQNISRGNEQGFYLYSRTSHNTMLRNEAYASQFAGFALRSSNRNFLKRNIARGNGQGFVLVRRSSYNRLVLNVACNNPDGDAYQSATSIGNVWIGNEFCKADI